MSEEIHDEVRRNFAPIFVALVVVLGCGIRDSRITSDEDDDEEDSNDIVGEESSDSGSEKS